MKGRNFLLNVSIFDLIFKMALVLIKEIKVAPETFVYITVLED